MRSPTERAAIGNAARGNAAVSVHADGGPPGGRGFAILEPVADGINNAIVGPSATLGSDLRTAFAQGTGEPVSSYDGIDGIQPRNDLAGINRSTIPKVFIECANMRNAADPRWSPPAAGSHGRPGDRGRTGRLPPRRPITRQPAQVISHRLHRRPRPHRDHEDDRHSLLDPEEDELARGHPLMPSPGQHRAPPGHARDSAYAIVPRFRGNIEEDTRQPLGDQCSRLPVPVGDGPDRCLAVGQFPGPVQRPEPQTRPLLTAKPEAAGGTPLVG